MADVVVALPEALRGELKEPLGAVYTDADALLSADLLAAFSDALDRPGSVLVRVDGEEDLAALPAVLVAPDGAAVVYGQPGEGMVLVTVDEARRDRCRDLLAAMDGDAGRLSAILER